MGYIIVDGRMRNIEKNTLKYLGYKLIELKKSNNVYAEISSHVDIFTTKINDTLVVEKSKFENNLADYSKKIENLKKSINALNSEVNSKRSELFDISEEINLQDFGIYKPHYDCLSSEQYKERITGNRLLQKKMIKEKTAMNYFDGWTLDGSKSKGRAMNNDNMKMVMRAFNYECDSIIDKVKYNNIEKIKDQIYKSANTINKLNIRNKIEIRPEYINLKIQELELDHEYSQKKQEEKEILREQRAEEREQAKLQKEIEAERKKIQKEQTHYQTAKEKYLKELTTAEDSQKEDIVNKIKDIDNHLEEINKNLQDIDYRQSNQRAGYVYVISNIGSFGENIYKIGMTRRLDPQDRVDELGDASVPFTFDVHAMIFSDDAPALENALHKAFEDKKVNLVNNRKEFFNVTLEEIKKEVKKHQEKMIEIKDVPEAEQYRESLMLRKAMNK